MFNFTTGKHEDPPANSILSTISKQNVHILTIDNHSIDLCAIIGVLSISIICDA